MNVAFGKSLCPTLSQMASMGNTSVEFGYDISSGCILHLNRSVVNSLQKLTVLFSRCISISEFHSKSDQIVSMISIATL